jgi:hypothetical protein
LPGAVYEQHQGVQNVPPYEDFITVGIADDFHPRKNTGGKSYIDKIGDETGRLTPVTP